jgi:branched-chain amino acid transport system substrate-binding protein
MACSRKRCLRLAVCASVAVFGVAQIRAQESSPSTPPYAVMDRETVAYQGPGRGHANDIQGDSVSIAVILPVQGKNAAQGELLRQAAQIALDMENAPGPLTDRKRFALVVRNESEQWGQASNAIVQLITQDDAVAVITSTDGRIAHQAEQIANKLGEPILTLSSDPTTTQINIPWIFRVGPSDTQQARLMLNEIFSSSASRTVLLIASTDYDGRVGGDQFMKAASSRGVRPPQRVDVDMASLVMADLLHHIRSIQPDAIVIWSDPEVSQKLLSALDIDERTPAIYLCQKAADSSLAQGASKLQVKFVGTANSQGKEREFFEVRFAQVTGEKPDLAAEHIYEAVRTVINAVRRVGPNRARVRDYLANEPLSSAATSTITFDPAGNSRQDFGLFTLLPAPNTRLALATR